MKRILFIITGLVDGGAEKALLNLLSYIDKTKYKVDVLVVFADKMGKEQPSGISFHTLFDSHRNFVYKLAKHLYLKFHIPHLLRYITNNRLPLRYDVIVSFLEGDSLLYHSFLFDRAKKNVSWIHTDFVENHWSQRHFVNQDEVNAYKSLDVLVFVSQAVYQKFMLFYQHLNDERVYICPNIINVNEIISKSQEPICDVLRRKFTICSVGRIEEVKGYDLLIDAAVILRKRNVDVDFWVIGKGSKEQQLHQYVLDKNIDDMVKFLGYQSNPYPYMKKADVLLSTSRAEGLPLFLSEAICLEKPIIATKTVGAEEVLQNGKYGRLVDITPIAIADAIQQFISNPQICSYYQNASIEGNQQYNPYVLMKKINDIFS